MYVMSNRLGADFNLAALPDDLEPDLDPLIFDTAQMKRIYDWAHEAARTGYEWRKVPPGLHSLEVGPRAVEAGRKKR